MDWRGRPVPLDADGLPTPLRFRLAFDWKASVLGVVLDAGRQLVLQQLGEVPLSPTGWIEALVVGAVSGVLFPSLGRLGGVVWVNRAIRKARAGALPASGTAQPPSPEDAPAVPPGPDGSATQGPDDEVRP